MSRVRWNGVSSFSSERTRSRIIWAATTPVNPQWHEQNKGFVRLEADVDAYNEAAATVATELGLEIDDLFGAVEATGRDSLLGPDGVHFYTRPKVVTTRWPDPLHRGVDLGFPRSR